ncbi:MAG: PAS domain-containing protein [Candidatus Manganitrophus sp.]|nr:PAS domain-containing protein [Candidatus Manganitrophus sp.]
MEEGILFRLAFDQASVGMVVLAMEPLGQFIQVNPAFCRMTGYSREELLARDFQSITAGPKTWKKTSKGYAPFSNSRFRPCRLKSATSEKTAVPFGSV